jgi:hypothetical protein
MKQAIDLRPELGGGSFDQPGGIVNVDIDPATGLIATEDCAEHRQEIFISGTEPVATCTHEMLEDPSLVAEFGDADSSSLDEEQISYSTVTLDVCGETGALASSSCSHVTRRSFEIGKEPTETCSAESHGGAKRARPPVIEPITDDKAPDNHNRVKSTGNLEANPAQPTVGTKKRADMY